MEQAFQTSLQAKVFDFALGQLIRDRRNSFQPLWSIDSWAKFLIWMSLNCGLSGDRESLELFAKSLGAPLTSRMRKIFFERILESDSMHILADPADPKVFIMTSSDLDPISLDKVEKVLKDLELSDRVLTARSSWQINDSLVSIPWKPLKTTS